MNNSKIAIVANNAATHFRGESFLPYHFFKRLHARRNGVYLLVHERCRDNLKQNLSDEAYQDVIFFKDTILQRILNRISSILPTRVADFSTLWLISLITEKHQKRKLKEMIINREIDLIHHCSTVSPRLPSLIYGLNVPCIVGPLNGNMNYPPGMQKRAGIFERIFVYLARKISGILNWAMPEKLMADAIIVANQRTVMALSNKFHGTIYELVENGIDLSIWSLDGASPLKKTKTFQYVYCGALIDYKSVDLLLHAFKKVLQRCNDQILSLTIIGDGPLKNFLMTLANVLGIAPNVSFTESLKQKQIADIYRSSDVFVFPSIRESGGAVVLEAMAMELPVIVANWGGPQDYVTEECGILIDPVSRDSFVDGLAEAMIKLYNSPELRKAMSAAGRERVCQNYEWEKKIDRLEKIYDDVLESSSRKR